MTMSWLVFFMSFLFPALLFFVIVLDQIGPIEGFRVRNRPKTGTKAVTRRARK